MANMPDLSESIVAIREGAKEEPFTYLTILEYHVTTPGVLPTLYEVLQNAEITQDIGWDLVKMLIEIEGSEGCLETVARLGNPREVIIAVMETLVKQSDNWDPDEEDEEEISRVSGRIITLIGMLAILQRRIKAKRPSRFLGTSLYSVLRAYHTTPEITTAIINLVRSLSGRIRPPLPTRTSSINVANPDENGDFSRNAPDPEAEPEDPEEDNLKRKYLQVFTTRILKRYVNAHNMQWAPRLYEIYHPDMVVPGRVTATSAFREDEVLRKRDAVVGQLVALLQDLGLDDFSGSFLQDADFQPGEVDSTAGFDDLDSIDSLPLSPGGVVSLGAYWMFSTDAFNADNPDPEIHLFPHHLSMMRQFLGTEPQVAISNNPGITDALLAIGLGLHHRGLIAATEEPSYMAYHHCLTLISVFHPDMGVRNAATRFAGVLLHSDPDDESRLDILEDLLENCQFSALKACAVKWLQEEVMTARNEETSNRFSEPGVIERLQYNIFPDMVSVANMDSDDFFMFLSENVPFLLQTANFAYFLFNACKDLVPEGIGAAVEQRFAEPLLMAAQKFGQADELEGYDRMELSILSDRLESINFR